MNAPFEWAPLFTAEKFNEGPGLDDLPLLPTFSSEGSIWKVEN